MGCLGLMVLAKSQHKGDGFTPSTNVNLPSLSHSHYLSGNWSGKRESWRRKKAVSKTKFAFVFLSPRLFPAFKQDLRFNNLKIQFSWYWISSVFSILATTEGSETHCTMGKLKNWVKSSQLWRIISLWILDQNLPNLAQSCLNSPKTQINTNI